MGREGCFGTRDVYYDATADAMTPALRLFNAKGAGFISSLGQRPMGHGESKQWER